MTLQKLFTQNLVFSFYSLVDTIHANETVIKAPHHVLIIQENIKWIDCWEKYHHQVLSILWNCSHFIFPIEFTDCICRLDKKVKMGNIFSSSDSARYAQSLVQRMCPVDEEVSMGWPNEEEYYIPCCPGRFVFTCPSCGGRWTFGEGSWSQGELKRIE